MERCARALPAFDAAHRTSALRASRRMVSGPEAEDIVQEALARAVAFADVARDADAQRAWVHRVMANLAANHRRWRRVRLRQADALVAEHPTCVDPVEADPALRVRLREALDALTPPQRAVVTHVYFDDRTLDEAAAAMGCAPGTARSHLHRALTRLREALVSLREAPRDGHRTVT